MVEIIAKILKVVVALSLILLSVLLFLWFLQLQPGFQWYYVGISIFIFSLIILFMSYSALLLRQVVRGNTSGVSGMLDEEELNKHKPGDGSGF